MGFFAFVGLAKSVLPVELGLINFAEFWLGSVVGLELLGLVEAV